MTMAIRRAPRVAYFNLRQNNLLQRVSKESLAVSYAAPTRTHGPDKRMSRQNPDAIAAQERPARGRCARCTWAHCRGGQPHCPARLLGCAPSSGILRSNPRRGRSRGSLSRKHTTFLLPPSSGWRPANSVWGTHDEASNDTVVMDRLAGLVPFVPLGFPTAAAMPAVSQAPARRSDATPVLPRPRRRRPEASTRTKNVRR